MKKSVFTLLAVFVMSLSASAQKLANVQAEARFVTDKMVLELGLSNVQRNNILQLNLTYLDAINGYHDINGKAWKYRNKQMRKMLSERQWKKYKKAYYFYQPIGWKGNAYIHNIYAKYPEGRVVCAPKPKGSHPHLHPDKPMPSHFGKPRPPRGNNSPKAIKERREMRKGVKFGAR